MKICIVIGTRPEIIKMSPVIRACQNQNLDFFIVHSTQHYSKALDEVFFTELELPLPNFKLSIDRTTTGSQLASMIKGFESIFLSSEPDVVLVQGDTNTVLCAALAASRNNIPVGHVEAGLRSFNDDMPEESNRITADHISRFLFAPTKIAEQNLINEKVSSERIFLTGNTIVDAVFQNHLIASNNSNVLGELNLKSNDFFLATVHRQESVDRVNRFRNILEGLSKVAEDHQRKVVLPLHPRSSKRIKEFNLAVPGNIHCIPPITYFNFLALLSNSLAVLTDSGGVQEEACILGVPCVTMRIKTERPETVDVGANTLTGYDPEIIAKTVTDSLEETKTWSSPYGEVGAGERIVEILLQNL